jgi:diguanylate cyclase (GGDEF)-like protein
MATRSDSGRGHRAPREHVVRELRRVNRALLVLGECNQALVRAGEEEALLADVCRILVDHGRYRMAWVGYAECDAGKSVRPVAKAGDDDGYLDGARIGWGDDELGHGPSGEAIRTGQAQVNRDFRSNPAVAPWRAEALRRGFESSVAIPLEGEVAPLGVLCVYAAEPDAFDGAELRLLEELAKDLTFGIVTLRSREAHRRADAMVSRLAYFDTLTGLPNRTQLLERLERSMGAARESGGCLALLTVNVNRFDDVQIGLGLREGDEVLRQLAARLGAALVEREFLARVGGDVFAVLVESGGDDCARAAAVRLHAALAEPFRVAGILLDMQARIGAALFPGHGADGEVLMLRSNIACRDARRSEFGFATYSGATDEESPRRLALIGELRRAIGGDELVLHYQPKVALRTGRVVGVEALVRWRHPVHGLLAPGEFIATAERTGLIKPLTARVLDIALRQARRWADRGLESRVAINISPSSLRDPEFPARVAEALDRWGAVPGWLKLELTESTLVEDPARALEVLTRLRALGVSIFIDDFGTGYSSLSYIATLPIQGLKIDRSFVAGMLGNAPVHSVVEATISLSRALQIRVVAEGVETREQAEALARLGCDEIQGYHVGAPMAADEFERWAAQRAGREAGQPAGD